MRAAQTLTSFGNPESGVNELLTIVGVTAATFAATSLDNLGLVAVLAADGNLRFRDILAGYVAAALLVVAAAYWAAEAIEGLPGHYLGLIGLVPIAVGVLRLYRLRRPLTRAETPFSDRVARGPISIALMMLAQSGDSLAAFTAVFTDTAERLEPAILITVSACVVAWCLAGRWLVTQSAIAGWIERRAAHAIPVLLIVVGLYVLLDTNTDVALLP